ncbi:hypothetical protein FRACYDRAFT_197926 [Fragilariopsis cylindrus CCMP1102]|uniref:DUF6824 domain-containing protein n=1 Tax=Fragilariopsis cylindrus CCMP1102 TaxID=635003 RepID=A0A1E7EMM0_9STRA|nr:hypothetical protein FRACYDRAFT_197926 [Fragilariopsis cylindrus CCMP1102]|eukprot:OEU07199.1 hypothetical protein FRACYDRAFT_197926 [Fragilariopsis cylindrus CCMP1102]
MVAGGIGCGGGGTLRRIRTPTPQDVLSGRGGGINSHPGNKVFREWVRLRKGDYKLAHLARNKKETTVVATEVVRQVQQQNGRFLTKDTSVVGGSGGHWWVEIDEKKALAKTTQALREGGTDGIITAPNVKTAITGADDDAIVSTRTTTEDDDTGNADTSNSKSNNTNAAGKLNPLKHILLLSLLLPTIMRCRDHQSM